MRCLFTEPACFRLSGLVVLTVAVGLLAVDDGYEVEPRDDKRRISNAVAEGLYPNSVLRHAEPIASYAPGVTAAPQRCFDGHVQSITKVLGIGFGAGALGGKSAVDGAEHRRDSDLVIRAGIDRVRGIVATTRHKQDSSSKPSHEHRLQGNTRPADTLAPCAGGNGLIIVEEYY